MKKLTRYSPGGYGAMVPDEAGEYLKLSDSKEPLITIRELAGNGPNKFTATIHRDKAGVNAPTLAETVRAVLDYLTDEIHSSEEGTCFSWRDECLATQKELAAMKERYRWIPVSERMPEPMRVVLVTTNDDGEILNDIAYIGQGAWSGWRRDNPPVEKVAGIVTHWREIDLPTEEVRP
jgi:hypothetical protein